MAGGDALREVLRMMHLLGAVGEGSAVSVEELAPHLAWLGPEELSSLLALGVGMGYVSEAEGKFYLTFRGEISVISISS